jgi:hypothetical protein
MSLQKFRRQDDRSIQRVSKLWLVGIILLMSLSALVWILNSEGIVRGNWSTIFSIVFMVFSSIIGLLQWHAQISPGPTASCSSSAWTRTHAIHAQSGWKIECEGGDGEEACMIYSDRHVYVYRLYSREAMGGYCDESGEG